MLSVCCSQLALSISADAVRLTDEMMRPSREGTRWLVEIAVNASAAETYFAPIRAIGIISATARSLTAGEEGQPRRYHGPAQLPPASGNPVCAGRGLGRVAVGNAVAGTYPS